MAVADIVYSPVLSVWNADKRGHHLDRCRAPIHFSAVRQLASSPSTPDNISCRLPLGRMR
jgi:hypothetical protein